MFEVAELGRKLDSEDYDAAVPGLRTELLALQRRVLDADFPVIVLLNGIDGGGRSETANLLHEWMDARHITARAFDRPTDSEKARPPYWRYWMELPPKGKIAVLIGNWYATPLTRHALAEIDDGRLALALSRINDFEASLVADGALLVKLWFHLSAKAHEKRIAKLAKRKETRWRISEGDIRSQKHYDAYRRTAEQALRLTSTAHAPWTVIEGKDRRYREVTVGRHLAHAIGHRLHETREMPSPPRPTPAVADPHTILDTLDLNLGVSRDEYERRLERGQARLNELGQHLRKSERSVTLVFEGWDAAGKGGTIRRLIKALDARFYQVIPVAAPTDEERVHPYLWRFWRRVPRSGRISIYDRSWYGRVLVERVEGFATPAEWMRAYKEINDFEEQLVEHGIILSKFWLHISAEEQLRRFREREATPWKRHKITEEDWRNREKWSLYEVAANEMIGRTSTACAPWTLVEAQSKHFARVKVLETLCDQLEAALIPTKKNGRAK